MADRATNEYLNTERAINDDNDLFAAIGKQVLGLRLGDDEMPAEDDRVKIVDEIESLCMNCHEDVSYVLPFICDLRRLIFVSGHDTAFTHKNPILSRNHPDVLLLRALPVQEQRDPASRRNAGTRFKIYLPARQSGRHGTSSRQE